MNEKRKTNPKAGAKGGEWLNNPPEVSDLVRKIFAGANVAQKQATKETQFCATPGCSESKFQNCHAIAEASQIRGIAERGKVCWIPMQEGSRWKPKPFYEEVGVSKVLIFRGFCNRCDNEVFQKIDKPLVLDPEIYALLAYRASCFANWRAKVDLRALELLPEKLKAIAEGDDAMPQVREDIDQGSDPEFQGFAANEASLGALTAYLKSSADGAFDNLETAVFDFGRQLPVRFSVSASFTLGLRQESVRITARDCVPRPAVFLHLLEEGGTTKLILSWPSYVPARFPQAWIDQLEGWSASGHLADVLWRYMFINNFGLAFKPSVAEGWTMAQHRFLTGPLATQMYNLGKIPVTPLHEPALFGADAWQLTRVL